MPAENATASEQAGARGRATTAPRLRAFGARLKPYAPALAASAALCGVCAGAILTKAGEPALPLDDAFIHLQYARRLAGGAFFSYVEGAGYSTGATSLLWPLVLAPFYAVGLRGLSIIYVTWALGALFHAALTVETTRVAHRLAGRAAAAGAAAMSVGFGALAWFAWSGMETVPFAWILMRTARRAAAWSDPPPNSTDTRAKTSGEQAELIALGLIAPLVRPEGAIASLLAAVALARSPRKTGPANRLLGLAPLAGPLLVPLLHLALTGRSSSSAAQVKWLPLNPYYDGPALLQASLENALLLITDLLNGGDYTVVFLPEGLSAPILLGFVALFVAGRRRRATPLALSVAAIGLGALLACSYLSLLWNRVRYIWPFAPAFLVMLACLAREVGDLIRRVRPSMTFATPLLCGLFAGALFARLPWAVRDLAQSAAAVAGQQVKLGRWAAQNLPPDARIGVNDTGAIAYMSGLRTFDVVGLTTPGEARYWVAGPGSRFEHYEMMDRAALPTHFIVYPHWMACSPVLGDALEEATVVDQSILGGSTMIAYEARYDLLGSGEAPSGGAPPGGFLDALDVSDLESEAAHSYELGATSDEDNLVAMLASPAPAEREPPPNAANTDTERPVIADGGRFRRTLDRFTARLKPGAPARLILRVSADDDVALTITAGGRDVGSVPVPPWPWVERSIDLPAEVVSEATPIAITAPKGAHFHAFHYWLAAP
ncbi:MAG TPA: hypothetical protein VE093_38025 [Polyangiaceae bacterium]|nr:hypothetical protein [Polyangiaceae bacterium]